MSVAGSIHAPEFGELEPCRRELTAHCYRMLASPQDTEDAVQDALIRAWRGLARFEDRGGLRPWLYRIATNVCLDVLKSRDRRALPMDLAPVATGRLALGTPLPEATWVQPLPDHLVSPLEGDPADVAVSRESIRLAFIAALQQLVPRQRAVLILRDSPSDRLDLGGSVDRSGPSPPEPVGEIAWIDRYTRYPRSRRVPIWPPPVRWASVD